MSLHADVPLIFLLHEVPSGILVISRPRLFGREGFCAQTMACSVLDYKITLTPQLLAEIRDFATSEPSDDSDATLRMLDEYTVRHARDAALV